MDTLKRFSRQPNLRSKISKLAVERAYAMPESKTISKESPVVNGSAGKLDHEATAGSGPVISLTKEENLRLRHAHISDAATVFFSEDPLKIVRARGQYMYDENGAQYLDCINNVAHVGHCHPKVVAAISAQLAAQNTNSRYLHDNLVMCAKRITEKMPKELTHVFFVNSGTEANDLAVRLARLVTGSKDCIILDHAYHGTSCTITDLSPHKFHHMKNYKMKKWVRMAVQPDAYRGTYRSPEYSEEQLAELYAGEVKKKTDEVQKEGRNVCLFMAESHQSCAGQVFLPDGYLQRVYEHVRKAGGLCLADEVQTGYGRLGSHYWGFEQQGVTPDFVTIGKAMGNGFPVAALVTTAQIANTFSDMGIEFFNTYGGNPASCAAALAVMDVIEEEDLMKHAKDVGDYLLQKLYELKSKYPFIGDVRGKGLFLGIEIVGDREARIPDEKVACIVIAQLRKENIILSVEGPQNNVIKIKPPMCFDKRNADYLCLHLDACMSKLMTGRGALPSAAETDDPTPNK